MPCICLDDWSKHADAPEKIDFIKIDIEGSEVAALQGGKEMLAKYNYPPIFIESNSYALLLHKETQKSLLKAANEIGYKAYILKENIYYTYDIGFFPTDVCVDFLLMKNIPESISYKQTQPIKQNDDDVIRTIIKALSQLCKEEISKDACPVNACYCYALKDFPHYLQNDEVKSKLDDVYTARAEDKYMQEYLGWYLNG